MDLAFFLSLPHAALADLGRSTTHYSGPELSNLIAAAEKVCDDTKSPKVPTEGFSRFVTSTTAPIATGWSESQR